MTPADPRRAPADPHAPVSEPIDPLALDPGEDLAAEPPAQPHRRARAPGLTADGRLRTGRLAGLSMSAAIWVLCWPILTESFLTSAVGLTDTILAAQLSPAATDAIGGASYIMWFVGLIAMAVGIAATALVSRAVGGGRTAVANAATGQAVILSLLSGIVAAFLLAGIAPFAGAMLNLSPEAAAHFTRYVRIVSIGVPCIAFMAASIAGLRGAGDSLRPLLSMVVVNAVNIAASWVLSGADYSTTSMVDGRAVNRTLIANPFGFDLGIAGVAWGTVIGEFIGAGLMLFMLVRGSSGVRLRRSRLRPHWHTIRRLLRIAIPNFLETLGIWIGNFLIILIVGLIARQRGEGVMGTHIVAVRIESFSYLPGFAMGTAAAALAGQYLGAGSPALARRAILRCTLIAAVIMGLAGMVFLAAPRTLVGLVSSQEIHLRAAPMLLTIAGFIQIPFAVSNVLRSALRGAGDGRMVMYLMWVATYLIRLPLAFLLSGVDLPIGGGRVIPSPFFSEPSLAMVWVALCGEIVIRAGLFAARFARGNWMTIRV